MANVAKPINSRLSPTVGEVNLRPPRRISSRNSDVSSTTTDGAEKPVKKLPPIKAPVGLTKGPDLKNCKSKVGSLNNIKHTPTGGAISITTQKLKWNAKSKVGSLENKEHKPGGGNLKVETRKLEWKTTSKVQSLQNVKHKPGGGNVKIFNESYVEKKESSTIKGPDEQTTTGTSSSSSSDSNTEKNNEACETKLVTSNMKSLNLNE